MPRPAPLRLAAALLAALAPAAALAQALPTHIGSERCADCHRAEAEAWAGSHHALAWTLPGPDTVVADFDGTAFSHDGMTARFRIGEDGSYHVSVTETDGTTTDHRIHSVIGIAPLQQYLIETEPGRLQSFDVVWDTERGRWFHLYPEVDLPPDDAFHWTGPYKTWNARCAECHATGFAKNYDADTGTYSSAQAEIGVGCEACHGPGSAHLAWADGAEFAADGLDSHGFTMSFDGAEATIRQCAGCHSRREAHGDGNPLPGTPYHDAYNLSLLRPGLYHADGQILDEVYVYGSFLQSRMYASGVSCTNCHEPHSARLVAEGNAVCSQCHGPEGNPEFPTLTPGLYDDPAHHHHEPGGAGAQCVACHMVERTYMGVDGRRDHSFRIPRPDLADATGAPDACTDCHDGRDDDWAAARIAEWFPESGERGPHYGVALARGRLDPASAGPELAALATDAGQPGIVRATALWLMGGAGDADLAAATADLLADPDPLVRGAALTAQRAAPDQDRVLRIVPLLDDPVRNVRIAAAREMLDAPVARLPDAIAADLRAALGEWQASLGNRLDFPETHLQLAGMALTMRNPPAASAAFREVVALDPQNVDAWVMLARIAAATQGPEATREVLEEALSVLPGDPALNGMMAELDGTGGGVDDLLPPAIER